MMGPSSIASSRTLWFKGETPQGQAKVGGHTSNGAELEDSQETRFVFPNISQHGWQQGDRGNIGT